MTKYARDTGQVTIRGFVRACIYGERSGLVYRRRLIPNPVAYARTLEKFVGEYMEVVNIGSTQVNDRNTALLNLFRLTIAETAFFFGGDNKGTALKYILGNKYTPDSVILFESLRSRRLQVESEVKVMQDEEKALLRSGDRGKEAHFIQAIQVLSSNIGYPLDYDRSKLVELITAYRVQHEKIKAEEKALAKQKDYGTRV